VVQFVSLDVLSHPLTLLSHSPLATAVSQGTGPKDIEKPGACAGRREERRIWSRRRQTETQRARSAATRDPALKSFKPV